MPPQYPMKIVCQRTGLSPHLIRVWERRYGAVTPARSASNRRLYSEADIERLALLQRATEAGHAIGQVARMTDRAIAALLAELPPGHEAEPQQAARTALRSGEEESLEAEEGEQVSLNELHSRLERLDGSGLARGLGFAAMALSRPRLIGGVIEPLLHALSDGLAANRFDVRHERLLADAVRDLFEEMESSFAVQITAPELAAGAPLGQTFAVGPIVAEAAARSVGWKTSFIGTDLVADRIAEAVKESGARALALSVVDPPEAAGLRREFRTLRRRLPETPLLVGGRCAFDCRAAVDEVGGRICRDAADFCLCLEELRRSS